MSTASSVQQPNVYSPRTVEPDTTESRSPRAKTRASGFRIGFFFRKIQNGQIVFEKRFPSYGRSTYLALALDKEKAAPPVGGSGSRPAAPPMMMADHDGDGLDDEVIEQDGPGMGDGNPGPIGGTSYEVGVFAGTLTTS